MTTRRQRQGSLPVGDVDQSVPDYDWHDRRHWGGGRRRPCRVCGQPSFLLDRAGLPAHKVCVNVTPG